MKIKDGKKISLGIFKTCFYLVIEFINIIITMTLLIGAITGILLLYLLFPEIGIAILYPLTTILGIMIQFIFVFIYAGLISLFVYVCIQLYSEIETLIKKNKKDRNKKYEKNKEKFINDIVKKLKESDKKEVKKNVRRRTNK